MPHCPKCERYIEHVHVYYPAEYKYYYSGGGEDDIMYADSYATDGEFPDGKEHHIECPDCGERLFEDDLAIADNFFKKEEVEEDWDE